ncbi:MAG: tyrosine--tRNA ligase [Holosporaceae bacterium]|jgi:tyrosyl-tRNA synthetase|nr:tyrosine--tRNA ligase [Holosporaceae bacterium]
MKYKSSFLIEAERRGFLYQFTDLEDMDAYLARGNGCGYIGFDITAKSLHIGSLIQIALLRLFQKHGHRPIVLVGGGTTKVGDPTLRNTMRPMLADEQIAENMAGIQSCLLPFLKFGDGPTDAIMVNNADWLDQLQYIPFLRDIGRCFSINRMIGFDSVKSKLTENNSLSFLEFNYMVMQAYDFLELHKKFDCHIQFGGQDQWGNIVCGVDLIKKKLGRTVFGCTTPLLTTSDGKKMGKTAGGAVWISADMYGAYDFWQYFRNVDDADVIKMMYLFTSLHPDEIKKMESFQGQELNTVKKLLADEVTALVHGASSLEAIHRSASGVFAKDAQDLSTATEIPQYMLPLSAKVAVVDILVDSGLCQSRGEAKRLLRGGGVSVDGKVVAEDHMLENLSRNELQKLTCGKKKHLLIVPKL